MYHEWIRLTSNPLAASPVSWIPRLSASGQATPTSITIIPIASRLVGLLQVSTSLHHRRHRFPRFPRQGGATLSPALRVKVNARLPRASTRKLAPAPSQILSARTEVARARCRHTLAGGTAKKCPPLLTGRAARELEWSGAGSIDTMSSLTRSGRRLHDILMTCAYRWTWVKSPFESDHEVIDKESECVDKRMLWS